MAVQHKDLTGSDLHEPKGVATASSGEVYIADGAASGAWGDPLGDVANLNSFEMNGVIADISTAGDSYYIRVARDCTLTDILFAQTGTISGTDAVISLYRDGVLLGQSQTIAVAGSGDNIKDTLALSPTYAFTEGQILKVETDGGSTNAHELYFTCKFTAT